MQNKVGDKSWEGQDTEPFGGQIPPEKHEASLKSRLRHNQAGPSTSNPGEYPHIPYICRN